MNEEQQATALQVPGPNGPLIPAHWQRMTDLEWNGPTMIDNFDGDAYDRVMLRTKACGPKDLASDDLRDQVFEVRYWCVHVADMVSKETGEITKNLRTVLISPAGIVAAFVSGGVAASLGMFVEGLGPGPWDPPLRVCVREGKNRGGQKVLSLTLAPREDKSNAKRK